MSNPKALSGRRVIFISAISLSAGLVGTLIGKVFGASLDTSLAWVGPVILLGSIALVLAGVLLLPTAIREYRASNRGTAA